MLGFPVARPLLLDFPQPVPLEAPAALGERFVNHLGAAAESLRILSDGGDLEIGLVARQGKIGVEHRVGVHSVLPQKIQYSLRRPVESLGDLIGVDKAHLSLGCQPQIIEAKHIEWVGRNFRHSVPCSMVYSYRTNSLPMMQHRHSLKYRPRGWHGSANPPRDSADLQFLGQTRLGRERQTERSLETSTLIKLLTYHIIEL